MNTNEEKICRTCLTKSSLFQSIFYDGPDVLNVSFAYMISCSSSVHINLNDGLPDIICFQCAGKILEFYKFKLKIEENDLILKSRLSNVNVSEDKSMQDCEIVIKKECLNDNASFEEIIKYESCEIDDREDSKSNEPKVDYVPKEGDDHQNNSPAHEFVEYPMDIKEELSNLSFCSKDTEEDIHMKNFCDEQEPSHVNKSKPDDDSNETRHEMIPMNKLKNVPLKSKCRYEAAYNNFKKWIQTKNLDIKEESLLTYFVERGKILKSPGSTWSEYSMLKTMISLHYNINISKFPKLINFLKTKTVGYCPKKSKVFTLEDMNKFLSTAPDEHYLLLKVVMITGIAGACRREELVKITIDNIEDLGSVIVVKIPTSQGNCRSFTIIDNPDEGIHYLSIFRKYLKLRPNPCSSSRFFCSYRNGKCVNQSVGINTMGRMPLKIAQFLNLKSPDLYTGHSFRRSSIKFLASQNVLGLKKQVK